MSEWRETTLGEVGTLVRGRRFTKNDYVDSGLGCIHYGQVHTHFGSAARETITFIPEGMRTRMRLASPGDVVVAATSENIEDLGKATAWLGTDEVAVHDDCYIFRHTLDPTFASHFFSSPTFDDQKVQYASGTKVTRISGANLAKIRIAVPSLPEQRRIVDVMGAVDAQVEALEVEAERCGRAVELLRAGYPEAEESALSSVLAGVDSGKSVRTTGEAPRQGDARVLKLSAVRPGRFDAEEAKRLDDLTGYTDAHLVSEGDLLVTRANTPERVGYAAVVYSVPERTYMPDLIWRARVDPGLVSADYLGHLLSSPEFRARVTATAGGTSTSMVKINKKGFGAVRVPVPSLDEQAEYVATCNAASRAKDAAASELARLRAFRAAILSSLLSQDVEIPASYDDLLENVG